MESPITASDERVGPENLEAVYSGFEIIISWAPPRMGKVLGYEVWRSYDGEDYSILARIDSDQLFYIDSGKRTDVPGVRGAYYFTPRVNRAEFDH